MERDIIVTCVIEFTVVYTLSPNKYYCPSLLPYASFCCIRNLERDKDIVSISRVSGKCGSSQEEKKKDHHFSIAIALSRII